MTLDAVGRCGGRADYRRRVYGVAGLDEHFRRGNHPAGDDGRYRRGNHPVAVDSHLGNHPAAVDHQADLAESRPARRHCQMVWVVDVDQHARRSHFWARVRCFSCPRTRSPPGPRKRRSTRPEVRRPHQPAEWHKKD